MIALLKLLLFVNLLLIFSLASGKYLIFNNNATPKLKASWGVLSAIAMFLYLILFLGLIIYKIIRGNISYLWLVIFIMAPFIIGSFAKFKRLDFYSNIQILVFTVSAISILILIN